MKAKNGAQVIVATVQSELSESYLRAACWREPYTFIISFPFER